MELGSLVTSVVETKNVNCLQTNISCNSAVLFCADETDVFFCQIQHNSFEYKPLLGIYCSDKY